MRATVPRLVRVVTRSQLSEIPSRTVVQPLQPQQRSDIAQPSLIETLLKRKASLGDKYPSNIRIEPVLTRDTFKDVPTGTIKELKELLKER
ncbi:hypothetical protein PHLGIDRAFT_338585 [Phlebiopsis gigantea 11061_1 CR5-6]|uniref:Uncharacterized protein n=1 Tax=Phlebiopsis gigantea (strain 11061_1 CR5-6) TaxID=745531 RepID=A0A0C3S234_PHLG1|nr:hypothetical protein PHLGIDRAFT_338585 [Phlebiopsis gigantea 11061_1 CR5-6]